MMVKAPSGVMAAARPITSSVTIEAIWSASVVTPHARRPSGRRTAA
jgi:hypothetical protein